MGVPLDGYSGATLIRASPRARIYDAVREDGLEVVATVFEFEREAVTTWVELETQRIAALAIEGLVPTLAVERVGAQLVVLSKRVRGVDPRALCHGAPLDVDTFLPLARRLGECLSRLHAHGLVHGDVRPDNIIVERDGGQVLLTLPALALLLGREPDLDDPRLLPYIAPEHSCRTGQPIDARSDLFALGVCFYELLTGALPAAGANKAALLHAILTEIPQSARVRRPQLPEALSRMLSRMLEKDPARRYQSAAGLVADLARIKQLIDADDLEASFELGRDEQPGALRAPRRLHGREREQALLVAELEYASRQQRPRLLLISGPQGAGKSALAAGLGPEVLRRGGLVGHGQFDAERRRLPYLGWTAALDHVLGQLRQGPREQLAAARSLLVERLGHLAALLGELLPNLEPILGELPPRPRDVGPRAIQNRLHLAISRLLGALSASGPLLLILDDLHAADDSSLDLLTAILDGGECGSAILLGCSRPGDSRAYHKLAALAARLALRSSGPGLRGRALELGPIGAQAQAQIVRDLLGVDDRSLAAALAPRAHGNPQRLLELVATLAREGLLEHGSEGWAWAPDAVASASLPNELDALIRARLAALDDADAELLRRATCIGPAFELRRLEPATERRPTMLLPGLSRLRAAGLIAPLGSSYRFIHPGLRELAATELATSERQAVHHRIGAAMLAGLGAPDEVRDCELYIIVDHLDAGLADAHELEPAARERLVTLNLDAGLRALASASHDSALRFLEFAAALVAEGVNAVRERGTGALGDELGGELVFEIYFARARALALSDEPEAADAAFAELLDWQLDLTEHGRAVAARVELLVADQRHAEAVALGLAGLRRCGVEISAKPRTAALVLGVSRAWLELRAHDQASLRALRPAQDPAACAAMDILTSLATAAYAHDPKLFVELTAVHALLTIEHGAHPSSPLALAQLAMSVAVVLRRGRAAARLADCALAMVDDTEHPSNARAEAVTHLVYHLSRPLADSVTALELAHRRSLALGEFEFVGYLASLSASLQLEVGTPLRAMIESCHRFERELGDWSSIPMRTLVRQSGALAAALAGDLDAGLGEIVVDEHGTPRVLPINPDALVAPTPMPLYTARMLRGLFHLIMGEHEAALEQLDQIVDFERVMMGSWSVPRVAMAHAVAAAARHGQVGARERRRLRKIIEAALELTRRWAKTCATNYAHFRDLVLAELTILQGTFYRAMALFERARDRAQRQGCAYVAALACERMAAHLLTRELPTLAAGPLREAASIYRRWGARAKLRELERQRSHEPGDDEHSEPSLGATTDPLTVGLETVTTALAAISEELDPELLACKILEAAITHTGAEHGALLVEGDAGLAVAARGGAAHVHAFSPPLALAGAVDILPLSLIELAARVDDPIVIDDARADGRLVHDPYIERAGLRSLACVPLAKRGRRLGLMLVEDRRVTSRFGEEHMSVLGFVATVAGGALENANLYRALHHSEVQWRSLVDGAPDLIALLDAQGELTFVNRSLPGWTAGRRPILDPDSRAEWTRALAGALEHGRRGAVEIALLHSESEDRLHWYDAHVAPLEIEGEARRVMLIATEITERKLADAQRLELEGQLRQQQRLESLGTLASGVAHEINNPIQAVLNYAELIVHSRYEPELIEEFAGEVTTEAQRVATIVRSLLAFSRREAAPEHELTTITTVFAGTRSLIHSTLRNHQIELLVDLPEGLPPVRCRSQQIQQVVMNLITNARDALNDRWPDPHPDKRIEIRAGAVERRGRELVRISVIDTGGGIPDSIRAHIFDPFFTTKGRDQGTGLGLSVSHGIVQEHGGELTVESELGVGTRFHLDLPAA